MKVVCTNNEAQRRHAPESELSRAGVTPYPECPERYDAIRTALEETTFVDIIESAAGGVESLATVHEADYLDFLRTAHTAWLGSGGEGDLSACVFSDANGHPPADPAAATGYYGFDTTPITAGTWTAACAAANATLEATDLVRDGGEHAVYALSRPPGHHATGNRFGGYCFLNHAALCAANLATKGKVAIVDVDYHHGNGTQEIFYARGDVLFISLHADPEWEYPLYWGRADETGSGEGHGATLNIPLPRGVQNADYLRHLSAATQRLRAFAPTYLVVSVGFDTWKNDPLGTFQLSAEGIGAIGACLAELALPTVIIQEGGYDVPALGDLAVRFLAPFA